ncbi:TonB-dependent receptor [Ulvibacterium sp.]|uniref:TonB-dependent receptor n=1 Tax=Ulvibacterium sp. TaxID=2665914 RepID=UPI003CC66E06
MFHNILPLTKKIQLGFFVTLLFPVLQDSDLYSQQNENPYHQTILEELHNYAATEGPEKIYVQTDKEFYGRGETIWFKAYLVDGITHIQSAKSKIAYVELWSEKDSLIAQRKLYIEDLGAAGDIKIGDSLSPGTYTLRAYTKYMLNEKEPLFFQKQIPIWDLPKAMNTPEQPTVEEDTGDLSRSKIIRPQIEFFPEGGYLVEGLENVMGLKVTDGDGNGLASQGKILDENHNPVAFFRTFNFGLGSVNFTPEAGKTYFARIDNGEISVSFPLPKPLPKGYVLNLKNKGGHILINVTSNHESGLQGLFLLGHLRGEIIYKHHIDRSNAKGNAVFKLSTEGLRDGVAQFTLFAEDGEPLCERLVFLDSPENLELTISTEFIDYGTREPVSTMIALKDKTGGPLQGELSVSVVSGDNIPHRNWGTNFKSWLLLDSDLGVTVADPDYFFMDESSSRKQLLDLLMLTHGWRRFVWKDFQDTLTTKVLAHAPEKGIVIRGRTTAFYNSKKSLKSQVKFTILDAGAYQEQSPTNSHGEFSFGPFIFQDSIQGVLNAFALGKKGKPKVAIYTDSTIFSVPFKHPTVQKGALNVTQNIQDYLETARKKKEADFINNPKITRLEEVTVIGEEKTRAQLIQEKATEYAIYKEPTMRLFTDSLPGVQGASMMDMLRRVPGAQVFGTYPDQVAILRVTGTFGAPQPLYVVDGAPATWEFVRFMMASQVVFLDVLKGGAAAIYGARGGTGVVAIYTKGSLLIPPPKPKRLPGVASFNVSGVYKAREFYSPNYAVPKEEHEKPDYRTTLHWEPALQVTEKGSPSFSFYTGDNTGEYVIKVEGMTQDGRPVEGLSRFTVNSEDSKM